jgi:diguanylate cyclase (GGDEF)-like protein/PAS domain S-box-containing protein
MNQPLKLLVIEDVTADFLLLERVLQQQGLAAVCLRVDSDAQLEEALRSEWDLVLGDYNVPGMNFRTTLKRIHTQHPELQVIMVSGSVGEETAVDMLRLGLTDFILKDHLARLPEAIRRAVNEAEGRRARQAAEDALKASQRAALDEQRRGRLAALSLMEDAIAARAKTEEINLTLKKSEALMRGITDNSSAVIFVKDLDGRYLFINQLYERLFHVTEAAILGKTDYDIFPPQLADNFVKYDRDVAQTGNALEIEETVPQDDGIHYYLSVKFPLLDAAGKIYAVCGISTDITERRAAEEQIRTLSLVVEQSPESIAIVNLDTKIEYVNETLLRNTGYSREEVIGQNPRILHSGKTPRSSYDALWKNLTEGKSWQGEFYNKRKDGSEYTEHAIISPIRQPDGRITHYMAIKEDITEKKRSEAQIHRLAFYDTLTGLPNLVLLLEHLAQTLIKTRRVGYQSALISFNIDRFKNINDAAGQTVGDNLLKAVAERLIRTLREGDFIARLSGDEFAILLPDVAPLPHLAAHLVLQISQKLHAGLNESFELNGERISLTACHGIAIFPDSAEDTPLDILRRANTALHHAKNLGGGQTAFFDDNLEIIAKQRFTIERELHQAITANEIRVYLQPQVDAAGKIVGAEALVRWQHPKRGLVPPDAFIPIAEESNLIIELGTWVFNRVCHFLASEEMSSSIIRIAVNISPRHFRQPDFVEQIKRGLSTSGADPTHLTLEVTEGMVIDNINDVIAKMSELSLMGIHFSMDDFGTGYSSLSYLKRLPFHELKIDKSFVQDIATDPNDAALVETILSVAKHMHLKVVAEGVETTEQAAFLNQHGTVIHQGYLFGKPEPIENWLTRCNR